MTGPEHVPVVVVGGGPTGLSAAILLGRRGVGCLVLERRQEPYPLPRAVHFDDEAFRVFASMGLAARVRAISRPAPGMRLTDPGHRVLAEFRRDPAGGAYGYPQANMFDQPDLERVLRGALAGLPGVQLRGGAEVTGIAQVAGGPAPVRVRYRCAGAAAEREVWAGAVLGCDGVNGITRGVLGAAMRDLGFEQEWLVVDAASAEPLGGCCAYQGVQQVCDHERAATFMPVVAGRYRWEFRLRPGEQPDAGRDALLRLVRPWLAGVDPDRISFLRHARYTFRGAVADRWRDGRVFLLGDAAHQTPPFIGQGLCAGIGDAANLAWKLALVHGGRAGDRLLDTYESERRPYTRRMIRLAILVGWLMTGGSARTAAARRAALRALTRLPGVEDRVVNAAWPALPAGPLVQGRSIRSIRSIRSGRSGRVGRPLPQPRVGGVPLDELLGTGFAVLHRGAGVPAGEARRYFEALGTAFLPAGDAALHDLLDRCRAGAVLVRPDRIVAAAATTADLAAWRRQLMAAGIAPDSPRA